MFVVVSGVVLMACGGDEVSSATTTATSGGSAGSGGGATTVGSAGAGGTGGHRDTGGGAPIAVPEVYAFESRFAAGESSVAYTGQTLRQVLVEDLKAFIKGMSDSIDAASYSPTDVDEVVAALNYYYAFDGSTSGTDPLLLETTPPTLQENYDAIASNKQLKEKMAGNDADAQHKDWSTEFTGWSDASIAVSGGNTSSPEGLLTAFFGTIGAQAVDRANGIIPTAPDGVTQLPVHVTPEGQDVAELVQKFLAGAVAFSQGTDDYLDDATDEKGLNAPNTQDAESPYTVLEHAWDEAFGYFGAARNYAEYTDAEIAGSDGRPDWQIYHDTSRDSFIDLTSEYNFGASTNAAKRDLGSVAGAETDFTKDAWDAFLAGRTMIANAGETLSEREMTALKAERDIIVSTWEKAIAATIVHYINDVLKDMNKFYTADYKFLDHAKHWSELKGFALGLQFNPSSPVTDAEFVALHESIGDGPVLEAATADDIADYKVALLAARDVLLGAYGFAEANMGDADGNGGW